MATSKSTIDKNLKNLAPESLDRMRTLNEIERKAIAGFSGPFDQLESAIGMLRLGDHLGWRVLVLIHNKRTLRIYEEILDINVREFFPEEGPSAHRSTGFTLAIKIGNFWKAVSGAVKDDEFKTKRREIN